MQTVAVVFPNQLFPASPVLSEAGPVFLLEHPRFFHAFRFHKKKLMFHRASMKAYARELTKKGQEVHYVDQARLADAGSLEAILYSCRPEHLRVVDVCDAVLDRELRTLAERISCELHILESPQFMSKAATVGTFFKGGKHLSMAQFYRAQRRRFGILMDDDKPVGGKWSFDAQNRRALPRDVKVPRRPRAGLSGNVREAAEYVQHHFPDNPGSTEGFFYPVTTAEARRWLKRFLDRRLAQFGPYEDSISTDRPFLFHSLLSPLLNAGLLTPADVIVRTLKFSEQHEVPLNSLEGFIRQIIGWREFIRAAYLLIGQEQRSSNFWCCRNMLPTGFYTAQTAMEPVDAVIRRVLDNAFAHHIERLMILGNFMLLCEIHPDEVYRWFMELFIDGYDWVMTPNIYGMSQYADGGRITTKPYVSSSNYVRKMSDFPPGAWCDVWDALFWRFVHKHKTVFAGSPRMKIMAHQLDRMAGATLQNHIHLAECYLATLFRH